MNAIQPFNGFAPESHRFFAQLKRHNDRAWFNQHKQEYQRHVLEPAAAFVVAMGQLMGRLSPGLVADPGPGGSIFRVYRDTRFSSDKTPYKTHLGIYFWQGPGRKMEHPGFYFELDEEGMGLYAGWYILQPEALRAYRKAVADEQLGAELVAARRRVEKSGLTLGGQHYKRIPRGFSADGDRGELLKHSGLYTEMPCGRPKELYTPALPAWCLRQWKRTLPVYQWLVGLDGQLAR